MIVHELNPLQVSAHAKGLLNWCQVHALTKSKAEFHQPCLIHFRRPCALRMASSDLVGLGQQRRHQSSADRIIFQSSLADQLRQSDFRGTQTSGDNCLNVCLDMWPYFLRNTNLQTL